jgi:hypothetical protein
MDALRLFHWIGSCPKPPIMYQNSNSVWFPLFKLMKPRDLCIKPLYKSVASLPAYFTVIELISKQVDSRYPEDWDPANQRKVG